MTFLFANHHVVLKVCKISAAATKKVTFFFKEGRIFRGLRNIPITICLSTWSFKACRQLGYSEELHNIRSRSCPVPHKRMNIRSYPWAMVWNFHHRLKKGKMANGRCWEHPIITKSKQKGWWAREAASGEIFLVVELTDIVGDNIGWNNHTIEEWLRNL